MAACRQRVFDACGMDFCSGLPRPYDGYREMQVLIFGCMAIRWSLSISDATTEHRCFPSKHLSTVFAESFPATAFSKRLDKERGPVRVGIGKIAPRGTVTNHGKEHMTGASLVVDGSYTAQ